MAEQLPRDFFNQVKTNKNINKNKVLSGLSDETYDEERKALAEVNKEIERLTKIRNELLSKKRQNGGLSPEENNQLNRAGHHLNTLKGQAADHEKKLQAIDNANIKQAINDSKGTGYHKGTSAKPTGGKVDKGQITLSQGQQNKIDKLRKDNPNITAKETTAAIQDMERKRKLFPYDPNKHLGAGQRADVRRLRKHYRKEFGNKIWKKAWNIAIGETAKERQQTLGELAEKQQMPVSTIKKNGINQVYDAKFLEKVAKIADTLKGDVNSPGYFERLSDVRKKYNRSAGDILRDRVSIMRNNLLSKAQIANKNKRIQGLKALQPWAEDLINKSNKGYTIDRDDLMKAQTLKDKIKNAQINFDAALAKHHKANKEFRAFKEQGMFPSKVKEQDKLPGPIKSKQPKRTTEDIIRNHEKDIKWYEDIIARDTEKQKKVNKNTDPVEYERLEKNINSFKKYIKDTQEKISKLSSSNSDGLKADVGDASLPLRKRSALSTLKEAASTAKANARSMTRGAAKATGQALKTGARAVGKAAPKLAKGALNIGKSFIKSGLHPDPTAAAALGAEAAHRGSEATRKMENSGGIKKVYPQARQYARQMSGGAEHLIGKPRSKEEIAKANKDILERRRKKEEWNNKVAKPFIKKAAKAYWNTTAPGMIANGIRKGLTTSSKNRLLNRNPQAEQELRKPARKLNSKAQSTVQNAKNKTVQTARSWVGKGKTELANIKSSILAKLKGEKRK